MSQQPLPIPPTQPPKPAPGRKVPLDLHNIQGDILSGLPKKTQTLYFFQITNTAKFRKELKDFLPLVKSVAQTIIDRKKIEEHKRKHDGSRGTPPTLIPLVGVNIAFSHLGFRKLGINDANLLDTAYLKGQRQDAQDLGDKGTGSGPTFVPDWEEPFKQEIHGVFNVAGESQANVAKQIQEIEGCFDVGTSAASIVKITSVQGDARPGDQSAHEHFGYLDGVSEPKIIGFDTDLPPGPAPIRSGAIVLGHEGDLNQDKRDPWMVDGSFLVFRYLFQLVPEFDDFVWRNRLMIQGPGMTDQESADLLGARLIGRWKSGAPLDITPFLDDPVLGADPEKNNNFHFAAEKNFQKLCPFAAHVRKTLPRADLEELGISIEKNRIMRRGIQFGVEVTDAEKADKRTTHPRGLLFNCYQSSITDGFQFIQQAWINNAHFPFAIDVPEVPGLDPILGQGPDRKLSGVNPNKPAEELALDAEWVIPRGGEYFFTPSISALTHTIATQ